MVKTVAEALHGFILGVMDDEIVRAAPFDAGVSAGPEIQPMSTAFAYAEPLPTAWHQSNGWVRRCMDPTPTSEWNVLRQAYRRALGQ